ncbi:MAG: SpoIIE family protein phosphatase [Bacteroidetes bacterium]|jgi:sigma-B regulation protein RsbU (phosphoserine phosphatase)|nr:SpoIIE family protein phosphatase [Bacteroidota bacterium]
MSKSSLKRLRLSDFKLRSLLNVTQAINQNLSTEDLLAKYEEILREDLNIGKILIYKLEYEWTCLLSSGVDKEIYDAVDVENNLIPYSEITFLTAAENKVLKLFDILIPVYNNNQPLAFVIIGDIDEEGEGVSPTIKHLNFIQTLSNIILVAIENIRLFNESLRQEAIKKELELASRMQSMLIPDKSLLPKNDIVHIEAFYHPHFDVGGDYYDFIELTPHEFGFCIADVSGKGISAALLMSNFQANLRALFTHEISLIALIEKLNERVLHSANGEKFITIFVGKYNYKSKELEYITAGHNPPIMYYPEEDKLEFLTKGCTGVGMLDEIPMINKGTLYIDKPAKILLYTDGLIELISGENIDTGTKDIEKCITNKQSIEENIETIIQKQGILEDNASIFDDISILGVEFK